MSVLIFHPSVAPFVQQAARALHEAGALDSFHTTICDRPAGRLQRAACVATGLVGYDLRGQLRRRAVTEVPPECVVTHPFREWVRLLSGSLDRSGRLTDRIWEWAEPGFARRIARELRGGLRGVYGFEFASLEAFAAAHARGIRTVYDVPAPETLFVQEMLRREHAQFPELQTPYRAHTEEREARRTARRRAEWAAADLVIANSEFTKRTYVAAGLDAAKIRVVPYGAPPPVARDAALAGPPSDGPVRFLWAGTFGVRKGAHYLLEAWRQRGLGAHARLLVHGTIALPDRLLRPLPPGVELGGPISRDQLLDAYRQSDALVFPTLCDGFGLVVTEAFSCGLPVITTECAGAADLVRPGANGLLVRAGDAAALGDTLVWCLEHRAELRAMREVALATAAGWQWHDYRQRLAVVLRDAQILAPAA